MGVDNSQGWQQFLTLCMSAESEQQLSELLGLLLTLEERDALSMRALLIKELLKGEKTQREIAQNLHISIAKITRGSNALKIVSDDLKKHILETLDS